MELILALPQQLKKHNGGGGAAGKDCETAVSTATNLCSRSKIDSNKSSLRKNNVQRLRKDRVGGGKEGLAQNNYGRFKPSETAVFTDRNLCSKSKIDSNKSSLTTVDIAAAPMRKNNHEQRFKETAAAPIPVKGDSIGKKPIKLTVKIGSVRVDEVIPTTNCKLMMGKKNSGFSRANQKEFKTSVSASKQEEKKKELMKQEEILVKKGTRVEKSDYGAEVIRQMFGYYLTGADQDDEDINIMEATFAHHINGAGGCSRKKMRLN